MNKISAIIFLLMLVQISLFAQTKKVLTNKSIISLVESGTETDVINAKIQTSEVKFDVSAKAMQNLKKNGVSADIIQAMHNRQTQLYTQSITQSARVAGNDVQYEQLPQERFKDFVPKRIWTFSGGVNFSTWAMPDSDIDKSVNVGYRVGILYQRSLARRIPLYMGFGLSFAQKGVKINDDDDHIKMDLLYIQLPIVFNYRIRVAKNLTVIPTIGVYYNLGVANGISGNFDSDNLDLDYGYGMGLKGLYNSDVGLDVGVGIAYRGMSMNFDYEFGLLNVSKRGDSEIRNGSFTISFELSIFFRNKRK